jgi:hypothetical protein
LYVITGRDAIGNDFELSAGASSVFNSATADVSSGSGDFAYFLGLIADGGSPGFSAMTLRGIDPGNGDFFLFAIDDVASAPVPLPLSVWLLASGLALLGGTLRRRKIQ